LLVSKPIKALVLNVTVRPLFGQRLKLSPDVEPKFIVHMNNKFESLAVSEPSKVDQVMNREDPKPRLSNKKCKKVLLLGSGHGRGLHEQLHSTLEDEYAVTSIFKPNAALGDVVGDLKTLSSDLTKEDHEIIVGGPDISLERDFSYQIEEDLDNIAKNSRHSNVGFIGLLG
jgi:hypothetical protein